MCRRNIDRYSADSLSHYRLTIDRLSTDYLTDHRPTIDRLSTDYRPTVDRLSTDYRPLYQPLCQLISQSTLPTVNKIQRHYDQVHFHFSYHLEFYPSGSAVAPNAICFKNALSKDHVFALKGQKLIIHDVALMRENKKIFESWSIPPSLLISSSKMPFDSKKSKKAVCGMVWTFSGSGCVGHHIKSYMKYRLSKFTFIMCCNAEIIFFSHEMHAKISQKLAKQNHTYICLLITHAWL